MTEIVPLHLSLPLCLQNGQLPGTFHDFHKATQAWEYITVKKKLNHS